MIRKCDHCGQEYLAKRPSSRFCGARCRISANRRKVPAPIGDSAAIIALSTPFDPKVVLETIARDDRQPAGARVAACRALLADAPKEPKRDGMDQASTRAIALLAASAGRLN
jgi:hypothetical protein